MDGARITFPGKMHLNFHDTLCCQLKLQALFSTKLKKQECDPQTVSCPFLAHGFHFLYFIQNIIFYLLYTANDVKLVQMKQIHPLLRGGLLSVLGIRKSSVGPACVFDQINRLQTISTHTERHVLIYFSTSFADLFLLRY